MELLREPTAGPKAPEAYELAAIAVAVELLWPKPTVEEDVAQRAESVWKFANRWWNDSNILHRGRPSRPSSFS